MIQLLIIFLLCLAPPAHAETQYFWSNPNLELFTTSGTPLVTKAVEPLGVAILAALSVTLLILSVSLGWRLFRPRV